MNDTTWRNTVAHRDQVIRDLEKSVEAKDFRNKKLNGTKLKYRDKLEEVQESHKKQLTAEREERAQLFKKQANEINRLRSIVHDKAEHIANLETDLYTTQQSVVTFPEERRVLRGELRIATYNEKTTTQRLAIETKAKIRLKEELKRLEDGRKLIDKEVARIVKENDALRQQIDLTTTDPLTESHKIDLASFYHLCKMLIVVNSEDEDEARWLKDWLKDRIEEHGVEL